MQEEREQGGTEFDSIPQQSPPDFRTELTSLLNRFSCENASNTSDWILSDYLCRCLGAFDTAVTDRDAWYGIHPEPGRVYMIPDAPDPANEPQTGHPDMGRNPAENAGPQTLQPKSV